MANETKVIEIRIDLYKGLEDIAKLQKGIDELTKSQKNLTKGTEEYAKTTVAIKEQRSQLTTLVKESANEVKTIIEKVGHIQKLKAEVANLTLQYERLSKAQLEGTKGTQVLNDLKSRREELSKLNQAYGNYKDNVGNYSSATKMLGINLGQVMKEMPNFAISARIGIMSLTNNLPMLAETIKAVRDEQIALGKAFTAKDWIKTFSRSVFGLTGVMSIAMVAMQIWGGDIIKWVGSLFKADEVVQDFTTSVGALNKVLDEGGGSAKQTIESITKLGIEIQKFGNDSKYTKAIIDEFNKTFNTHYKTIEEVTKAYPLMAKGAIDAAIKMAAANDLIAESSKQTIRQMKAQSILSQYSPQQIKEATTRIDEFFNNYKEILKKAGFTDEQMIKRTNAMADAIKNGDLNGAFVKLGWNGFDDELKRVRMDFREFKNDPTFKAVFDELGTESGERLFSSILNSRASKVQQEKLRKSIYELLQGTVSNAEADPKDKKEKERTPSDKWERMIFGSVLDSKVEDSMKKKVEKSMTNLGTFIEKMNQNLLNSPESFYNRQIDKILSLYKEGAISLDEFTKLVNDVMESATRDGVSIYEKLLNDINNIFGRGGKEDDKLYRNKIDKVREYADAAYNILGNLNDFTTNLAETELQNWAKVNKGKIGYEEEYAAKKAKLEHDAAVRGKAMSVFGTIITTASSIMAAVAAPPVGLGAAGVPLAILNGINGAAQIATILATPIPTAESAGSSGNTTTTQVSEKFHTGTYRPSSASEEQEITRTLLTTERVLSPAQTSIFDSMIGRMQSYGGSNSITSGVGVNQYLQKNMLVSAFSEALKYQKPQQISWTEFSNQAQRQQQLQKNLYVR